MKKIEVWFTMGTCGLFMLKLRISFEENAKRFVPNWELSIIKDIKGQTAYDIITEHNAYVSSSACSTAFGMEPPWSAEIMYNWEKFPGGPSETPWDGPNIFFLRSLLENSQMTPYPPRVSGGIGGNCYTVLDQTCVLGLWSRFGALGIAGIRISLRIVRASLPFFRRPIST